MACVVLIPAYNPDDSLAALAANLLAQGFAQIVIVDDGSKEACRGLFRDLGAIEGCTVLRHAINLGKGRALKTGFNHIYLHHPDAAGVVTCDADGQHVAEDVARVGDEVSGNAGPLVMGVRTFASHIPLRSLIGNRLTRTLFFFLTGRKLSDTQSGLRGIPMYLLPELIQLEGERYEYEMNMLLAVKDIGFGIAEVPISTIYLNDNASSHFNPFFDSMKIYFVLLRFGFTSLVTSLLDQILFFLAFRSGLSLAYSIVIGRLGSSIFNLSVNRTFVFKSRAGTPAMVFRYYLSMAIAGLIAYGMINFLADTFEWSVMIAKVSVESLLFLASFVVNRDFVFTQKQRPAD